MDGIVGNIVLGMLRHGLTSVSGGLVAHGYLTGDQQQQAVGAILTVIGIGFSVYDKYAAKKAA